MHAKIKDLPQTLQSALDSLGYKRADIAISARDSYSLACGGGDGYRAFICAVNLSTGESKLTHGSWGGANMFNPTNSVDLDTTDRPLPEGFAVITGSEGGSRPVYASIAVNPLTLAPMLPQAPTGDLTDFDRSILAMYKGLTSAGRKNELDRMRYDAQRKYTNHVAYAQAGASFDRRVADSLDRLVANGLIKRNKAGSCQITTEGKNMIVRKVCG